MREEDLNEESWFVKVSDLLFMNIQCPYVKILTLNQRYQCDIDKHILFSIDTKVRCNISGR